MRSKEFITEAINPDCFNPAFNDTQIFDGLTYRATVEEEYGKPVLTVKVLDDNFQQAGLAKFKPSKAGVVSLITSFRPEYQGQGLARNIYAYVRALGNTIVPSRNQLPAGRAMWDSWKKSGDAKHLMRDVAEVAPPGAKAERMVKHIKQGYAKDGKLTPQEKSIAFATAWKAHNAGRVEEQGVAEGSLEEIDRRGFLKGLGAAAVAGAAGGAKADRNWTKDELTGSDKATMTSENFKGALLHYNEESKSFFVNLVEPTNDSINNIKEKRLYYPKITSPAYQLRFGQLPIMKGQGKVFSFPIRQLGDYNGSGIMLITTPKAFDSITEPFLYSNRVIIRLEIDGQPTNIIFNESPSVIEYRKRLDAAYAEQGIPSPYHNESVEQGLTENNHWHDAGVADARRDVKQNPDRKVKKLNPRTHLKTMQYKQARHPEEVKQYSLGYRSINPAESICSLEEAHEIFDDFEQAMAERGLTEDAFDTVTDEQIVRETAAWRRKAGKSAKGGLNRKGVASYRREHPGSHLQMAVTTKPSKLKPGSKAAKRRKSFCARMSGVKGPMKKPNGKPTRKALALRKWNC